MKEKLLQPGAKANMKEVRILRGTPSLSGVAFGMRFSNKFKLFIQKI